MYVVRFSTLRVFEQTDPRVFEQRVGRWLTVREAENVNLLGSLPAMVAAGAQGSTGGCIAERMFTVEDGEELLAAGILFTSGCFCMTWATDVATVALAEFMSQAACQIKSVLAPSHVSMIFAEKWAELTRYRVEFDRSERIYQLTRCTYQPPSTGKLEVALDSDISILVPWVRSFVQETQYEGELTAEQLVQEMIQARLLFIWKNPQPVAMAAWLSATPNGGSINFVFTPSEFRRRGHGKAVVAALGSLMLSRGRKYCFILTDTQDVQINSLYHAVGARTLCELLRCTFHSKPAEPSVRPPSTREPLTSRVAM